MVQSFQAFKVNKSEENFSAQVEQISVDELPGAEVLIKVNYSSVNYKDGMASIPNSSIVKNYPMIPGIDLAGEVVESKDDRFSVGDKVIATSYEIGISHYGGYSEYARIPGDWIVPLPDGMTLEESMTLGTAGFTAALSVHRLEENGLTPNDGKVLVTGATGGVGSVAIAMLVKRGYEVVASTGTASAHEYLRTIGVSEIISREDVYEEKVKPLAKQQWAAAVDPVGGQSLASLLSKLEYGGAAAVSGLTGGTDIPTAVFPFILRGVSLLGVDSVNCPMGLRRKIWERMSTDLKPAGLLEHIHQEISLEQLPQALTTILEGKSQGRMVVKL